MRIVIATESFLPQVNGVANSVLHTSRQLQRRGHEVLIVAPGTGPERHHDARVVRVRALRLPSYAAFAVGLPDPAVRRELVEFGPDLVHLAAPIALGATALRAAGQLGIPTLGVFWADVAGFLKHQGAAGPGRVADRWVASLHQQMDLTLAPSHASRVYLETLGVRRLRMWRAVAGTRLGATRVGADSAEAESAVRRAWEAAVDELVEVHYPVVLGRPRPLAA